MMMLAQRLVNGKTHNDVSLLYIVVEGTSERLQTYLRMEHNYQRSVDFPADVSFVDRPALGGRRLWRNPLSPPINNSSELFSPTRVTIALCV